MTDRQDRLTINFRKASVQEQELLKWIKQNGVVGGDSVFIKTILYKEFLKEKER